MTVRSYRSSNAICGHEQSCLFSVRMATKTVTIHTVDGPQFRRPPIRVIAWHCVSSMGKAIMAALDAAELTVGCRNAVEPRTEHTMLNQIAF